MSKKAFSRSKPEVDFQRQHFSIIASIEPKHMPFEFRKSVYQLSGYEKKSHFPFKPEVDFWRQYFSVQSLLSSLIIYRLNFEILSNSSRVMSQKTVSEGHFRFSWPNRKQISKTKGGVPYSALNQNFWRLKFENPSIGSRVTWRQHYDIHTDIHTYIHTYIQTDRQTYIHTYIQTYRRN